MRSISDEEAFQYDAMQFNSNTNKFKSEIYYLNYLNQKECFITMLSLKTGIYLYLLIYMITAIPVFSVCIY